MSTPDFGRTRPLAPSIHPSAVYCVPDLDVLDAIYAGEEPGFIYARDGHPNARSLAMELAKAEAASWGIVTATGMGAISGPLLALVSQGERIVASNSLYGKTTKLLAQEMSRFGVISQFVDTNDLNAVRAALETPARILLVETVSNPLCRIADLPALAELAHSRNCLLFVDNTFASPYLCRPLEMGADLVMESLTKMIGGHSDVTLGFVGGSDAAHSAPIGAGISTWGLAANPFDCWLAERGFATLDLRMPAATANAIAIADWLAVQHGVLRVVYPGRRDHPDHELMQRILPSGSGNMLCFELSGGRDAVNRFLRQAPEIPFCPSLGHHRTTCSHPDTTSHRYELHDEKLKLGITSGLIRLSVGCEPLIEIQREMAKGLALAPSVQ